MPAISPSRGEIGSSSANPIPRSAVRAGRGEGVIFPLEGEMAGRPEGGAMDAVRSA
ncbi:ABC transporter ATP-binding protein, partial [Salmonella enterica subsp. enterica serovar Kottbus]|nr:ABC transporter ATP-binding protein [Salmonella enterica subsp. enterica serovar Kottbus]